MTNDLSKSIWEGLDAKRPILLCPKCGSEQIRNVKDVSDTEVESRCRKCGHSGNDMVEAVALTESELADLVKGILIDKLMRGE